MRSKSIQTIYLISLIYSQSFLFTQSLSQLYPSNKQHKIHYIPSDISIINVSHSYPKTIFRTLFSSVPKREYALQDITTSFGTNNNDIDNRIVLLIGASSSGKSTLLRLLSGIETPIKGQILFQPPSSQTVNAKPIIVDSKPSITDKNDSKNVLTWIQQSCGFNKKEDSKKTIIQQSSYEFAKILTLSDDQLLGKPSQLTPSGQYLFGLACACVQSTFHTEDFPEDEQSVELHCPILLLDELLDTEHSIVTQQVFKGLQQLTNMGGIVICVTHKPNAILKTNNQSNHPKRVITLSAGKILTDQSNM